MSWDKSCAQYISQSHSVWIEPSEVDLEIILALHKLHYELFKYRKNKPRRVVPHALQ